LYNSVVYMRDDGHRELIGDCYKIKKDSSSIECNFADARAKLVFGKTKLSMAEYFTVIPQLRSLVKHNNNDMKIIAEGIFNRIGADKEKEERERTSSSGAMCEVVREAAQQRRVDMKEKRARLHGPPEGEPAAQRVRLAPGGGVGDAPAVQEAPPAAPATEAPK
jgi:hypothetical protein